MLTEAFVSKKGFVIAGMQQLGSVHADDLLSNTALSESTSSANIC